MSAARTGFSYPQVTLVTNANRSDATNTACGGVSRILSYRSVPRSGRQKSRQMPDLEPNNPQTSGRYTISLGLLVTIATSYGSKREVYSYVQLEVYDSSSFIMTYDSVRVEVHSRGSPFCRRHFWSFLSFTLTPFIMTSYVFL